MLGMSAHRVPIHKLHCVGKSNMKVYVTVLTMLVANLSTSAVSIAIIILNALIFCWSTCRLFLATSAARGRIRMWRTEKLKEETTTKLEPNNVKYTTELAM